MKFAAAWSVATVFVALVGCHRDGSSNPERAGIPADRALVSPNDQDKSGTTTTTGASWLGNDDAIDRIVASRCAREVACSNVGPDKHFANGEVCLREVGGKMHEYLNASVCTAGIDGRQLETCVDAIRNESCTNPIDVVVRSAKCRTSDLCMKAEIPGR